MRRIPRERVGSPLPLLPVASAPSGVTSLAGGSPGRGCCWRGVYPGLTLSLSSLPLACLWQVATCARTTATASAPCTGRCTRCAGSWVPAAPRPPRPLRSCPSGFGTCHGRCVCAPAPCPAWPTASARRRGSSRATGLGPSRACSCPRRRCRPAP